MNETPAETTNGDKGVSTVAFVIAIGFIVLLVFLGVIYVVLSDRLNGNDAYRVRELREQRDGLKLECDENHKTLQRFQEWVRQNPDIRPPLEVMVIRPCRPVESIERPNEHK